MTDDRWKMLPRLVLEEQGKKLGFSEPRRSQERALKGYDVGVQIPKKVWSDESSSLRRRSGLERRAGLEPWGLWEELPLLA